MTQVCNKIIDCVDGVTTTYSGDYSQFIKAKQAKMGAWAVEYTKQQKRMKEDQCFIKSNKNKPTFATSVSAPTTLHFLLVVISCVSKYV
jgi:ATPase subunit of ABC transporter with duplicated ATPase domains